MPDHRLPDGRTPVLLTADDPDGLRDEAIALDAYLTAYPEVPPAAIADMLWRTRSPRRRRALILAGDRSTLDAAVDAIARGHGHPDVVTATVGEPRRIAMVIAGQGSQRPGLGAGLHAASAGYRAEVDLCLEHLSADRAAAVRRYLLDDRAEGADGTTVQPALVVHALGMLALWRDHGVVPDLTVGHSLGEIAAAVAAGLLDRRDAIRIAEIRAAATASVTIDDHAMAALGIPEREAAESIARRPGWAEITVVNGPESVCVNGDRATIADLIAQTTASGRFARPIAITHPAHTTAMRPLASRIRGDLAEAGVPDGFGAARIACIGGTLGARIPDDISVADYWYLNVRNTVRFDRAIAAAAADGAEIFVEIADHPILAAGIAGTLAGTAARDGARNTADPVVVTTSRRTARGLEEFSRALATVVLAQPRLDRAQWAVPGPVRLPLRGFPTTVMRRRRLWLPPADSAAPSTPDVGRDEAVRATAAAVAAPRPAARPGVARLVAAWEPPARKSIGAPRTVRVVDPTGDHGDWIALFAESARRFGATIHDSPDTPADTLLWAIPRGGEPADAVKQITAYLSDLAIGATPNGIDRVVVATLGAEHIGDDPLPSVFSAGAAVAVESLVAEWSGVRCVRLDLPATAPTAADAAAAMAAIHTVGERDFAIREGVVHVQRLRRADLPTDRTPVGSVVVIGGTGRLGLAYARRLIDRGARAVTLVNRGGPRPEQAAELADLRAGGATVEVVGCDITDPAAVAAFVRGRTAPIDLLVHAAVDYVHGGSADLDAAGVHRALAAKVDGLLHLLDGAAIGPGTAVDLCSSVSATFTGPGLAVYAAGNRMLDAIAVHLRAGGVHCRSVRWGVFGDPGAGTDAYRAIVADAAGAGLLDLTPDEAFDAGVTAAVDDDCLVVRADWETLARVCEFQGRPRLLPDPVMPDALAPPVPTGPSPNPTAAPPAAEAADPVEVLPAILRGVLGLEPDEPIDRTMPLVGLGVDSLQALDLNRMLLGALGRDIPATTLLSGASVDDLIDVLHSPPAGG